MTTRIVFIAAVAIVSFALSLAQKPTPISAVDAASNAVSREEFDPMPVGRYACGFIAPDDWFYWAC
jgi:hypothetical protein